MWANYLSRPRWCRLQYLGISWEYLNIVGVSFERRTLDLPAYHLGRLVDGTAIYYYAVLRQPKDPWNHVSIKKKPLECLGICHEDLGSHNAVSYSS